MREYKDRFVPISECKMSLYSRPESTKYIPVIKCGNTRTISCWYQSRNGHYINGNGDCSWVQDPGWSGTRYAINVLHTPTYSTSPTPLVSPSCILLLIDSNSWLWYGRLQGIDWFWTCRYGVREPAHYLCTVYPIVNSTLELASTFGGHNTWN